MRPRRTTAALLTAAGLVLAGCGGGPPSSAPASPAAPVTVPDHDESRPAAEPAPVPAAPAASVLPDLVVDDVGAGAKVNLASLAPSQRPVLLWMWAPH